MSEGKKRIVKPIEWIIILLLGLGFVFLLLQRLGVNVVNETEEFSFLDAPSGPEKPMSPRAKDDRITSRTDAILMDIATQFAEDADANRGTSKRDLQRKGLSTDEAQYYSDLQQRERPNNLTPTQWLNVVQSSFQTYRQLKSIIDQMDNAEDGVVDNKSFDTVLSDSERRNQLFDQIATAFGISILQLERFASEGGKSLGDWASFVEQNK